MCSYIKWLFITIFLPVLCLFNAAMSSASILDILVVDEQGNPIENSVIEMVGRSSTERTTQNPLIIDQIDKSFNPKVLVAPVNSLVNFPNSDNIRHHVYSFSPAKTFELKLYANAPKEPILFDQSGLVVLGCNIHDSMVGYIYVAEAPAYKTGKDGLVSIDLPNDKNATFTVWHPDARQGVNFRKKVNIPKKHQNKIVVTLPVAPPEPRNTFEDVFGFH